MGRAFLTYGENVPPNGMLAIRFLDSTWVRSGGLLGCKVCAIWWGFVRPCITSSLANISCIRSIFSSAFSPIFNELVLWPVYVPAPPLLSFVSRSNDILLSRLMSNIPPLATCALFSRLLARRFGLIFSLIVTEPGSLDESTLLILMAGKFN